jgi:hypothetical protein
MRPGNLEAIIDVAKAVESVGHNFVFTGACVLPFLVAKEFCPGLRTTQDVDVIVQVISRTQMAEVEEKLRSVGFQNDQWTESRHRCRWVYNGIIVDVMSDDSEDNNSCPSKWFQFAAATPISREIESGFFIRHLSAVAFLATKLDAFANRGESDIRGSKDLEDIVALIDGRVSLLAEVESARLEVKQLIALQINRLLRRDDIEEIVNGHLSPESKRSGRDARVLTILQQMAVI